MNWKTLAFASAVALGLGGAALADEAMGAITAIDTAALTVTLDDGNTYDFSKPECRADAACNLATFEVGDAVTIVWDLVQDKRMGQTISSQ
jgi:hypothetical protein